VFDEAKTPNTIDQQSINLIDGPSNDFGREALVPASRLTLAPPTCPRKQFHEFALSKGRAIPDTCNFSVLPSLEQAMPQQ
jgi:hypothetical protein